MLEYSSTTTTDNTLEDDKMKDANEYLQRVGEFFLIGDVRDESCRVAAQSMLAYAISAQADKKLKRRGLTLTVCSPGGFFDSGVILSSTIMRIRNMGFPVTIRVVGEACSMGSILLQYGTKRVVDSASQIMVHDVSGISHGNNTRRLDQDKSYQAVRQAVALIYATRNTGGHNDPQWWIDRYLDGRDHYLTPVEAFQLGLVDEIEVGIPAPPAEDPDISDSPPTSESENPAA